MTKRCSINTRPSLPRTLEDVNFIPCEWMSSKLGPVGAGPSVTYVSTIFLPRDFGAVNLWGGEVGGYAWFGRVGKAPRL